VPAEHAAPECAATRLHKADGIDDVRGNRPNGAGLLLGDLLVIADSGVKYTAAPGVKSLKATL